MKYIATLIRTLVGALFVFSGLIKVNDPVGTAIKMEEYFEVFSVDFASFFHVLVPISLEISVIFVVLEVVLGIALLINYKPKLTVFATLGLIIFFTVLTGYSAITNSVTDCGCFGDAIKLTPWQSFSKDIVLLVMLLLLTIANSDQEYVKKYANYIIIASTIINLGLAITAINHLPFIDFRAYKIGDHIPTSMQPSEPYIYEYVMEKDGKEYSFETYPTDKSYQYVAMNHLNPEAAPTITDFGIWNDDGDFTEEVFVGNKLYIIIYDINKANTERIQEINELYKGIGSTFEVFVLTASSANMYLPFAKQHQLEMPFYYTDATVLKTIVRSNPGVWALKDGTVIGKWHYNDIPNYSVVLDLLK